MCFTFSFTLFTSRSCAIEIATVEMINDHYGFDKLISLSSISISPFLPHSRFSSKKNRVCSWLMLVVGWFVHFFPFHFLFAYKLTLLLPWPWWMRLNKLYLYCLCYIAAIYCNTAHTISTVKKKHTKKTYAEKWLCNRTKRNGRRIRTCKKQTNRKPKERKKCKNRIKKDDDDDKKILYNLTETILIECIQMRILYPH